MKSLGPGRSLNLGSPVNWADPLNRGLVAWWLALPNYKGLQWRNLTSSGLYHGTLTNGPVWQGSKGRPGGFGSLKFDATDDLVDCGQAIGNGVTTNFTTGAWIRPSSLASQQNVVQRRASGPGWAFDLLTSGVMRFTVVGVANYDTTATVPTNSWTRVDAVYTSGAGLIYINGVQALSVAMGSITNTTGESYVIGKRQYSGTSDRVFNGNIDDVSFFNRALSASDIYQRYAASKAGYPTQLNWNRRAYGYVAALGGTVFNPLTGRGGAAAQPVAA